MANSMLTSSNIAATAAALVGQDLGLASLISRDVENDFTAGAGAGATVKVRVPGAVAASVRSIGDKSTPLVVDEIAEQYIDVTLSDDVYNSVLLSAGDLDLEIDSFAARVLAPQTRAISRYIERKVAEAMKATPEEATIAYSATAPAKTITAMRSKLRANGVPADAPLHVAVGAGVYADLLDADAIDDKGHVRGVTVHENTRLAADELVLFVKEAFALVVRAPQPPEGAPLRRKRQGRGLRPDAHPRLRRQRQRRPQHGPDLPEGPAHAPRGRHRGRHYLARPGRRRRPRADLHGPGLT